MTIGRDRKEGDELVSRTYRELGVEQTPESLNQSVLGMASNKANGSGTPNSLFAAWMKPVAWAATVGISLAIVLEVTDVPTAAVLPSSTPAVESIREEVVPRDSTVREKSESKARLRSGPKQQAARGDEFEQGSAAEARDNDPASFVPAPEVVLEETLLDLSSTVNNEAKRKKDVISPQAPAVDQAVARKLSAEQPAARERVASFAYSADIADDDFASACDTAVRQSADDWLACIEHLRQTGSVEAAELEHELFILEYPLESAVSEPNK